MRVILFGATGMVGQGVLRECMLDPEIDAVLSVVRRASASPAGGEGPRPGKLREVVTENFQDFSGMEDQFAGYDACFFCLGVSSFGMKEDGYRRVTYDITMAAADALMKANPISASKEHGMTFCYVSGAGTDAKGGSMWARVKGETENALLAMPFRAYMFRPGAIVPMHESKSKTVLYRLLYTGMTPMLPMLLRMFPKHVTTTEQVGRAMIAVAKRGYAKPVLEAQDIAAL